MNEDTRLFFVVDSEKDNEELYETLGGARKALKELSEGWNENNIPRIRVCFVENAYRDGEGWNYDDHSNTFKDITKIT